MAAAVTTLFPGTQCGIGPATDEGFFYDFVVDRPFVPEDLEAIEKQMAAFVVARSAATSARCCRRTRPRPTSRSAANRSRCS